MQDRSPLVCLGKLVAALQKQVLFDQQAEAALKAWLENPNLSMPEVLQRLDLVATPSILAESAEESSQLEDRTQITSSDKSRIARGGFKAVAESQDSVPSLPDLSDRFLLVEAVGAGGTSEVFRGEDLDVQREVAIKVFREQQPGSNARGKFESEAKLTASLAHAFIPAVYAIGQLEQSPCLVMELLTGTNLHQSILDATVTDQKIDLAKQKEFVSIIAMVSRALEHAHGQAIIHRDVKPANIFLSNEGTVKLGDWGHSCEKRDLLPNKENRQWDMRSLHGTLPFICPERLADRRIASPQVDIYSLGVTLYVAITGVLPFKSESQDEIKHKILGGTFPEPRAVNNQIPKPLEAICLKAMALEPAQRYASVSDFRADLEAWMTGKSVAAYDPLSLKLNRFLRKNVRALATVCTLLLFSFLWILNEQQKARASEREAVTQRLKAEESTLLALEAVEDLYLKTTHGSNSLASLPNGGPLRQAIQEKCSSYLNELTDRNRELVSARPLAVSLLVHAQILHELGESKEASKVIAESREIVESGLLAEPQDVELQKDLASIEYLLAQMKFDAQQYENASRHLEFSKQIREKLAQNQGLEEFESLAACFTFEGALLRKLDQLGEAEKVLVDLQRRLEDLSSKEPSDYLEDLAATNLQTLAAVVAQQGRLDEAVAYFQQCEAAQQRVINKAPWNPTAKYNRALTLFNIGRTHIDRREPTRAIDWFQKAQPVFETLVLENPQNAKFVVGHSNNLNLLAICSALIGQTADAKSYVDELLEFVASKPTELLKGNLDILDVAGRASILKSQLLRQSGETSALLEAQATLMRAVGLIDDSLKSGALESRLSGLKEMLLGEKEIVDNELENMDGAP